MPRGSNQHLKLYYLAKIMLEETDAEHGITIDVIISSLEDYDITAERKQLYKNLDELQDLGIEVDKVRDGNSWYYGGKSEEVKICIKNDAAGIFIDRFGADLSFKPEGEKYSTLYVTVMVSDKFYAWIFALGDKAQIIGPEWVVDGAKVFIKQLTDIYQ